MRSLLAVWVVFIALASGCSSEGGKEPVGLEKIDALFMRYAGDDVPGAAVMVIRHGEVIYQKGFGWANLETREPVTPSTNFRLASVSKQFTAMAVMQLIERGLLSLDSKLSEALEGFPAIGETITIRDLLRHTSGLVDYEGLVPDGQSEQVRDADVLKLVSANPEAYFPAGETYQYSNSGYALLALIVESVSGQSFSDYLQEHVFSPAEMYASVAFEKERHKIQNRAYGYSIAENGAVSRTDQSVYSAVLGDGGVYSSLNDLFLWDTALYQEELLSPEWRAELFRDQGNGAGEPIQYGFGWRLEDYAGHNVTYHTGSSKGFRNVLYRITDERLTVVILTNRNSYAQLSPLELARQTVDIVLSES
ncbi:serine hydrolase domain-containing protein [Biformimicrobium ophioploci]|uniref:Serine hydrolase domain-containing protein n=2 Tax=Biformimicrobium ophioploci TaxID=3036711 RepID=A0ABQ6M2E8_9GAMM|nr:serine hydrolase domain-containing protein [Microbulbifer sp. NKW57]